MDYMEQALALAIRALGTTSPNPAVGAVLVKDGRVVGQGYTQPPGRPHAEIVALRQAGEKAKGATLYVTLEPCPHYGRTPPCTRALITAGVAEVHMAILDPNPLVSGKGKEELEASGIRVLLGEHFEEAREINEAFFKYITTGFPFVIARFAMSLDGKIGTRSGESQWITGTKARECSRGLRRIADAIMVGVNTALADDPQLTARDSEGKALPRQPLRVVVDSHGHLPPPSQLLRESGKTLVAVAVPEPGAVEKLEKAGAEVVRLPAEEGMVDVAALLKELGKREITSVLVEGGGTLLGSLFDRRLVDKVIAFIAPLIIGGAEARIAVAGRGAERIAEALRLHRVKVEALGEDLVVTGYTS